VLNTISTCYPVDADGSSISSLTDSDCETEKEPTMNVEADEESINEEDDSNERTQVFQLNPRTQHCEFSIGCFLPLG
jgi:hypothetical protein